MITLKKDLNKEDIDSNEKTEIIQDYSGKDLVRISLYLAKDCYRIQEIQEVKDSIELIEDLLKYKYLSYSDEWELLHPRTELRKLISGLSIEKNRIPYCITMCSFCAIHDFESYLKNEKPIMPNKSHNWNVVRNRTSFCNGLFYAVRAYHPKEEVDLNKKKYEEYCSYIKLYAYEDLDFPYRKMAKSFNLDDDNDLNVFLDFLTDNYPEALTYSREDFLTNKLAREYLKVLYC